MTVPASSTGLPAEREHETAVAPPTGTRYGSRALSRREIASAVVGITAFLAILFSFPNHADEIFSLVGVAAALLSLAATLLTLRTRDADMLPPASDEFLAAADPTRPLPPPVTPESPSQEP